MWLPLLLISLMAKFQSLFYLASLGTGLPPPRQLCNSIVLFCLCQLFTTLQDSCSAVGPLARRVSQDTVMVPSGFLFSSLQRTVCHKSTLPGLVSPLNSSCAHTASPPSHLILPHFPISAHADCSPRTLSIFMPTATAHSWRLSQEAH